MKYLIEDIVKSVRMYPHTMIAVDIEGNIKDCLSLDRIPDPMGEFDKLIRRKSHKGCSVSFIRRDINYNKKKALIKIKDSVVALKYSKTNKLKPGVNIPGNKRYYSIRKKLAKELGIKE